jgi:hypothetical protein
MPIISIGIITCTKFSRRDIDRFGVNTLSNFFRVFLLDCSLMVGKESSETIGISNEDAAHRLENHFVIVDYETFLQQLKDYPIMFYIDLLGDTFTSLRIRRALKNKDAVRIKLNLGLLPRISRPIGILTRLSNVRKRGGVIVKIVERLIFFFVSKLNPKVDISIYSGKASQGKYPDLSSQVVWAHSLDYQRFLEINLRNNESKRNKYAVFIDQYAPSHPDYSFHGNKPPVTDQKYYTSMNDFFNFFEEKTGLNVIIASHPRRNQADNSVWQGRLDIIGKTPELIKESALVFSHYSTAISYAVLWRKPIVQLTTDEYINSYRREQFLAFSEALELTSINVNRYKSNDINDTLFGFNEDIYINYQDQYLSSQYSNSTNLWLTLANTILNYNPIQPS